MTYTRCKQVAMVAIGATMVGSITFSKKEGDVVKKGEQVILLYSQFWRSSSMCFFWCHIRLEVYTLFLNFNFPHHLPCLDHVADGFVLLRRQYHNLCLPKGLSMILLSPFSLFNFFPAGSD